MKTVQFRFKSFTYEIYDRPGAWMTQEQLQVLQERLAGVAVGRLGERPQYGFFSDTQHLGNKLVTICSKNGRDLCFNAMAHIGRFGKRPVVHLGSVYSLEGQKGQMQMLYLWSCLYLLGSNLFRDVYITSLTHTPCIFGAVQEAYTKIYPRAGENMDPEPFHLEIRDLLMQTYLKEFPFMRDPEIDQNFVIKGFRRMADGSLLFPDTRHSVPKHRKDVYNTFILERLDYLRGDDILQVGILQFGDLFRNGRIFRKGGRLRPVNVVRNIGAQLAGAGKTLVRWLDPIPMPHHWRTGR